MKEAVLFDTKLGTTRAGPKTRIWIEGKRLFAHGFDVGGKFVKHWSIPNHMLILETIPYGAAKRYKVAEIGTVSGKGEKPIIDITGRQVAATFDSGTHVTVDYRPGRITITRKLTNY